MVAATCSPAEASSTEGAALAATSCDPVRGKLVGDVVLVIASEVLLVTGRMPMPLLYRLDAYFTCCQAFRMG